MAGRFYLLARGVCNMMQFCRIRYGNLFLCETRTCMIVHPDIYTNPTKHYLNKKIGHVGRSVRAFFCLLTPYNWKPVFGNKIT